MIERRSVFRKATALLVAILIPNVSVAADCTNTKECAGKLLDAVPQLAKTDFELAKELSDLQTRLGEVGASAATADAEVEKAAGQHVTDQMYRLGRGGDSVPNWGNKSSPVCPKDWYAVGMKVQVATGGNAGMLYYDMHPICRRLKR